MFELLSSKAFQNLFFLIFNMSITASIMIGIVLLLRLALKKAPKIFSYALWAVVLFRLLCPVSFQAPFAVLNLFKAPVTESGDIQYVPEEVLLPETSLPMMPEITTQPNYNRQPIVATPISPVVKKTVSPVAVLILIWIAGFIVVLGVNTANFIRLRTRVACSIKLRDNIYLADGIGTPFCLGIILPKIYLPSFLSKEEQEYIILHEKHHIHRGDHIIKALAFLALCIHWFNPLVWLAFILAGKDMEMSCDEAVMNRMNGTIRAEYSAALLHLSTGRRVFTATFLSFGDGNPKQRIKNVMNYKKPAFWLVLALALILSIVAVCLIANPKTEFGKKLEALAAPEKTGDGLGEDGTGNASAGSSSIHGNNDNYVPEDSGNSADEIKDARELSLALQNWAYAFAGRDGNTIAAFSTDEVIENLKERELLVVGNHTYSFGYSSPWPMGTTVEVPTDPKDAYLYENSTVYQIREFSGNHAIICYYARTSEPHITCWVEGLTYEWIDKKLTVTGENLKFYDHIDNPEDYVIAYAWALSGEMDPGMDYCSLPSGEEANAKWNHVEMETLGEVLNRNALQSSSMVYRDLFEPDTAAVALLNLSNDPSKVKVEKLAQDSPDLVELDITFPGRTEHFRISMIKPYGDPGIWVPAIYQVDVVARFQKHGLDELKKLKYREDNIYNFDEIRCIGEIPGKDIRIYGYGDAEVFGQGVAVQIGEKIEYYDWAYASTRAIPPKFYWDERNKRLQMAFPIYSGTGASGEALHIIDSSQKEWVVGEYLESDYCSELQDKIVYEYDDKNEYITLYDAESREELCRVKTDGKPTGLEMGSIMEFELGEGLAMIFQPGYYADNSAVVIYDGMPWIGFGVSDQPDKAGKLRLKDGTLSKWSITDNDYQEEYDIKAIEEGKAVEMLPNGDFYPLEMHFSSGAGGWQTELTLEQDGSFTGRFTHDDRSENQTALCDFTGEFGDFRRMNENAYGMTLKDVTVLNPERKEWTENGSRYVLGDPYGIPGDHYIFYLPDTPLEALSDGFLSWRSGNYNEQGKLSCYGLLNVREEYGFFGEG